MDEGFVDLRQNHGHSGLDHSFWPSFTDIMTVVVMIFMITSTVLILRNWELVTTLRASLEAEVAARQEIASAQQTSRTLEEQLAETQSALSRERIENLQLTELSETQRRQIADYLQQLLVLRTQRDQLAADMQSTQRQIDILAERLDETETRAAQTEGELQQRTARLEEVLEALRALEQRQQQTLAQLGAARQKEAQSAASLSQLQEQYVTLEEKYQELIRPARSPAGKEVVEVRYQRVKDTAQMELRLPGESQFRPLSEEALHQRLSALKEEHGEALYVKIIIPADSGLSYSEAWNFTRTILNRYDYYYQE